MVTRGRHVREPGWESIAQRSQRPRRGILGRRVSARGQVKWSARLSFFPLLLPATSKIGKSVLARYREFGSKIMGVHVIRQEDAGNPGSDGASPYVNENKDERD